MNETDARQIIDAIFDEPYELSEWEENFIDSISKSLSHKTVLSEKQKAVLLKIYEKATDIKRR